MKSSVVLLSGGLDSAVCLATALEESRNVVALSFKYSQRHKKELDCAKKLARHFGVKHIVSDIPGFSIWKGSSLTDLSLAIPIHTGTSSGKIPNTYVPARNTVFLSLALSLAESMDFGNLYIGVNAIDYSNYIDCRPIFIEKFQNLMNVATKRAVEEKRPIALKTPLLYHSKAEIIKLGTRLEIPFEITWSCYKGNHNPCGRCDSCFLRLKGFKEANIEDPLVYP